MGVRLIPPGDSGEADSIWVVVRLIPPGGSGEANLIWGGGGAFSIPG